MDIAAFAQRVSAKVRDTLYPPPPPNAPPHPNYDIELTWPQWFLTLAVLIGSAALWILPLWYQFKEIEAEDRISQQAVRDRKQREIDERPPAPLLECIRKRCSIFPSRYVSRTVPRRVVDRLLEAAMWAPFHGPVPPWQFIVLGRKAMVAMQRMTLDYYDENWQTVGWADGKHGTAAQYRKWRTMTEEEIEGRWGPVSFMVAIVMRRQAGSKRLAEWEEAAATACAVQNMHLQASTDPFLACYWSSWHEAARDSAAMRAFLGIGAEDKCLGFFMVAACEPVILDGRWRRPDKHLSVEWRE